MPVVATDFSAWDLWWRFNKERYLDASRTRRPLSPSGESSPYLVAPAPGLIHERVVPALTALIQDESSGSTLESAVLLSLARIGEPDTEGLGGSRLVDTLTAYLDEANRTVAETACISLGVLGRPAAAAVLGDVLHDTPRGRKLTGKKEVSLRMRAFAAYGLGLTGQRTKNPDVRRYATHALVQALDAEPCAASDDRVASVIALGMIDASDRGTSDTCACASNAGLVARLLEVFEEDDSMLVRSHVPGTLAHLSSQVDPMLRRVIAETLIEGMTKRRETGLVRQGCALALGLVGDSDEDQLDSDIRSALMKTAVDGDHMTRTFAVVALAQTATRAGDGTGDPLAGARETQRFLLKRLARAKSHEETWLTLSLGIFGRGLIDAGTAPSVDQLAVIKELLSKSAAPSEAAVSSIASGLCQDPTAKDELVRKLADLHTEEVGHAALGLGMIGLREAIDPLHDALAEVRHEPDALENMAIALALLEDADAVSELTGLLEQCDCGLSRRAVAIALGRTRDARAAEPLLAMLEDEDSPELQRAYAAFGLAFLTEKDEHPWGSRISIDLNYRANPASLLGPSNSGILDLP